MKWRNADGGRQGFDLIADDGRWLGSVWPSGRTWAYLPLGGDWDDLRRECATVALAKGFVLHANAQGLLSPAEDAIALVGEFLAIAPGLASRKRVGFASYEEAVAVSRRAWDVRNRADAAAEAAEDDPAFVEPERFVEKIKGAEQMCAEFWEGEGSQVGEFIAVSRAKGGPVET